MPIVPLSPRYLEGLEPHLRPILLGQLFIPSAMANSDWVNRQLLPLTSQHSRALHGRLISPHLQERLEVLVGRRLELRVAGHQVLLHFVRRLVHAQRSVVLHPLHAVVELAIQRVAEDA